ncbi:MAG: deacylase [Gammaproteobacteria bacterium]|nr:deacylase [Gammaproteobacteria bacterium]
MSTNQSPVFCEIDLDAEGKHHGYLRLPHSVHRSAYGWIPIPITSIKNGEGPVVLLMAGNHGDEYEGQIALCSLSKEIAQQDINGQIILLPMANFPAAKAGMRTSPLDDGNLNRSFPGNPMGTPTQIIAHFIESELVKRADYLLDIHSGGSSLLYIPSALLTIDSDPSQHQANLALVRSIGFPQALLFEQSGMEYYSSSAAHRNDCVAITLEVAGGGSIDQAALKLLHRGLSRYLTHIGINIALSEDEGLDKDPTHTEESTIKSAITTGTFTHTPNAIENQDIEGNGETEFLSISTEASYCYAYGSGLFEPLVDLGDQVVEGQPAGFIHDPETPWKEPDQLYFRGEGKVVARRVPARVERGDCLFEIAGKAAS